MSRPEENIYIITLPIEVYKQEYDEYQKVYTLPFCISESDFTYFKEYGIFPGYISSMIEAFMSVYERRTGKEVENFGFLTEFKIENLAFRNDCFSPARLLTKETASTLPIYNDCDEEYDND